MTPVIRDALALAVVPDSDLRAIAVYFTDMNQAAARASSVDATVREAIATSDLAVEQPYDADANLYDSLRRGRRPHRVLSVWCLDRRAALELSLLPTNEAPPQTDEVYSAGSEDRA